MRTDSLRRILLEVLLGFDEYRVTQVVGGDVGGVSLDHRNNSKMVLCRVCVRENSSCNGVRLTQVLSDPWEIDHGLNSVL